MGKSGAIVIVVFLIVVNAVKEQREMAQKLVGMPWATLWHREVVYARYYGDKKHCALYWSKQPLRGVYLGKVRCKELVRPFPVGRR